MTGFFTREMREQEGKRVGFSIQPLDGKQGILAHETRKSEIRVGKYEVNLDSLYEIVVPPMIASKPDQIVNLEEIGKIQCFSPLFRDTLIRVLDSPNSVIGSIAPKGMAFIERPEKGPDVPLAKIKVTEKNRDSLADSLSLKISFL